MNGYSEQRIPGEATGPVASGEGGRGPLAGLAEKRLSRLKGSLAWLLPLASRAWARLLLIAPAVRAKGEMFWAWRRIKVAQPHSASLTRYAVHLTVLLLAAAALAAGQISFPETQGTDQTVLSASPPLSDSPVRTWRELPFPEGGGFLVKAIVPHTIRAAVGRGGALASDGLPSGEFLSDDTDDLISLKAAAPKARRREIITYVVRSGDTVWDIAEKFGISPDTILWANGRLEDNPDMLAVGQELIILPVSGVYHTVEKGDTLESIAKKYKVDVSAITSYPLNKLRPPYELQVGQSLIVPGGRKPYIPRVVRAYSGPVPENAAKGTGSFGWPVSGRITQKYWDRHRALDIGASKGSPVYAADSGYVVYAGWSEAGYGYMVIIDHGNGFRTLYAHLSWYFPDTGQSVAKGELIGKVGSTGKSTGPHLHFEIIKNGVKRNPFGFLP